MLISFLFELTAEAPDARGSIYRTELAKVFTSILFYYMTSMVFANWL
jgi:hypothetical protein